MLSLSYGFGSGLLMRRALALTIVLVAGAAVTLPPGVSQGGHAQMQGMDHSSGGMAHMAGHMHLTALRPLAPGDQQKADEVVEAARKAMAPYQDYRKALADGYKIFVPNLPQPIYHFTNYQNGGEAAWHWDAMKPTSLLYRKTADGGYKLVGAMYTDRVNATEDELNDRIPLSVARWHQHVNFCKAPQAEWGAYFGPEAKFGLMGSINTKDACEAAGGVFIPHVFGWMVHVYPYETNPRKVWSIDDDDQDHDNMDRSPMPGMEMNSGDSGDSASH